ncbi:NmrA family protein [Apodospora peruviana]|uniref:NmrA family protein n=1 Tax=Apodospora peruviana TaxID=516989 RepID=A0AAE0M0P4_9PEZI|nr:NmrA family protein [Apodospora peruviana]
MPFENPVVFVCGATGSQGGAVAHQLRALDWTVHTTVRNLDSPAAKALKTAGVQLTQGDWDDDDALRASIEGCDKLFLCLYPNFADLTAEGRQAANILSIAKAAGVTQVVASTSLGVSQLDAKVHVRPGSFMEKHLTAKKAVEQAVVDAGFKHHTFLRPAFFMSNFVEPKVGRYPEVRDKGTWTVSMTAETLLPLIDHEDIGKAAVAAFRDPAKFDGKALGLASELLPIQETLDQLSEAVGRPGSFGAIFMTDQDIAAQANSNVLVNSEKTMRSMSEYVNLEELTELVGSLGTFRGFLERERESVGRTYQVV